MSPSTTPNLNLPYLDASQSQPEVKINEAFDLIDAAITAETGGSGGGGPGSITVEGVSDSPTVTVLDVTTLRIEGASVESETAGVARIIVPSSPKSVSPIIVVRDKRSVRRLLKRPPGLPPYSIPNSGVTAGTYNTANITVGIDGRITSAANGTVLAAAAPGLIADLVLWWASDDINMANGAGVTRLRERTPYVGGVMAASTSGSSIPTISAAALNSLNGLKFPTSSPTAYPLKDFLNLPNAATIFAVINPNNATTLQAIVGGASGGLALYLVGSAGTAKIALVKTAVSVMPLATNAWTAGTAFQCNATYNATSGAYAYRQARATNGSGTTTTGAGGTAAMSFFGADFNVTNSPLNGAIVFEVCVFNRVLSGTEITNMETYLFNKWGV